LGGREGGREGGAFLGNSPPHDVTTVPLPHLASS